MTHPISRRCSSAKRVAHGKKMDDPIRRPCLRCGRLTRANLSSQLCVGCDEAAGLGEPLEREEHSKATEWLRAHWQTGWLHVAPEGKRSARQGKMRRQAGVKTGVPDFFCFTPAGQSDIAIELKTPTGRRSKAQIEWEVLLVAAGWRYELCIGAGGAIEVLNAAIKKIVMW